MGLNQKMAVVFNGPPKSGKDFICDSLIDLSCNEFNHLRFKDKLFELVQCIYDIDKETFFKIYNNREMKDLPHPAFNMLSPRQAMIYVSEVVIKPRFGKNYFGKIAAKNMKHGMNVFSDGGFIEELVPVYYESEGNLLIFRVHKDECNFSKDSRGYIDKCEDARIIDIYNNSTKEDFVKEVVTELTEHFNITKEVINGTEY